MTKPTPTSQTLATLDDRTLGRQLVDQYHKAAAGMVEYVAFGAMAQHAQERINSARGIDTRPGGKDSKGTGLKAWLHEHAPEISLPTAYRYIELAEGMKAELKIGPSVALYDVLKAAKPTPVQQKLRGKIAAFVEGKSQRQLLVGFGKFDVKQGGARITTKKPTEAQIRAAWLELAVRTATETCSSLHELGERWQLLPDDKLRLAAAEAKTFHDRAEKWLKTPAAQRVEFNLEKYIKAEEQQ